MFQRIRLFSLSYPPPQGTTGNGLPARVQGRAAGRAVPGEDGLEMSVVGTEVMKRI